MKHLHNKIQLLPALPLHFVYFYHEVGQFLVDFFHGRVSILMGSAIVVFLLDLEREATEV